MTPYSLEHRKNDFSIMDEGARCTGMLGKVLPEWNPDGIDYLLKGLAKGRDAEQQLKVLNPVHIDTHILALLAML